MSPSVEPLDSRGASRTPWWRFPGLHTRRHVAHGPRRGDKQQLFASLSAVGGGGFGEKRRTRSKGGEDAGKGGKSKGGGMEGGRGGRKGRVGPHRVWLG